MTESLYQHTVLDRSRHPRFRRDVAGLKACCRNMLCGDEVTVTLQAAAGRIAQAGFTAEGCAILQAAADIMAESVEGLPAREAVELGARFEAMLAGGPDLPGDLQAFAPLRDYPARRRCASLPWEALTQALQPLLSGEAA